MKSSSTVRAKPTWRLTDRIRQARAHANLTKTELARLVGVCASAAVQWEHPQGTAPSVANLARIAQATDVAFEWLATGRGPSRVAPGGDAPAIEPAAMATTFFEERLLQIARQLPECQHEPLIDFLSACVHAVGQQRG